MRNKIFGIIILSMLFVKCSTKKLLLANFSDNFTGLYLYETPKFKGEKKNTIYINPDINLAGSIKGETSVKRDSWLVVPLIFLNYWDAHYSLKFGSKLISEPLDSLMIETLKKEINRSASFNIVEDIRSADYELTISVDSIKGEGIYTRGGFAYSAVMVNGYRTWERAGPFYVKMVTTYQLKKDSKVIFERKFVSYGSNDSYSRNVSDIITLQKDYVVRVVESMARVIKKTNVDITKSVDDFLTSH